MAVLKEVCVMTDNEQRSVISSNLKHLIRMSGKEQKQIALELGINPPTFNQWVMGKAIPSVTTLKSLASYFNVRLENIVNEVSPMPSSSSYSFSDEAVAVAMAYEKADDGIKIAVAKLLDIKKEDMTQPADVYTA